MIPRKRNSIKGNAGSLPLPARGRERLCAPETLPGCGVSVQQAETKLRKRGSHGLRISLATDVKRQQTLKTELSLSQLPSMQKPTPSGPSGQEVAKTTVRSGKYRTVLFDRQLVLLLLNQI